MSKMRWLPALVIPALAALCFGFRAPQCTTCDQPEGQFQTYTTCDYDPGRTVEYTANFCTIPGSNCSINGTVTATRCQQTSTTDACVLIQDNFSVILSDQGVGPVSIAPNKTLTCNSNSYAIIAVFSQGINSGPPVSCTGSLNADYGRFFTCQ